MLYFPSDTVFCRNIRYLRQDNYVSLRALSRLANISVLRIKDLEAEQEPLFISDHHVKRFCAIFGISVEDFFHRDLAAEDSASGCPRRIREDSSP